MTTLTSILVAGMAAGYLVACVGRTDLLLHIARWMSPGLEGRNDLDLALETRGLGIIAELLGCPWCLSCWGSLAMTAMAGTPLGFDFVPKWLAAALLSSAIAATAERLEL